MNALLKFALGAVMAGSAALVASPSIARQEVARSTPPRGEEARPCRYFVQRHLPAPRHCYRFLSNMFGPEVYVHDGFVFRDREAFLRWHEGHTIHMGERAEREDRYAERDRDRYSAREEERQAPREEREDESGGAARGPGSVHEASGGATRGESAEQRTSGGATRGERVQQHASGGASGY
ncbi:MAG TPA: hypothetical protein VGG69_00910 [Rhizomicrobium sp.]|jgi:hypothetical protein